MYSMYWRFSELGKTARRQAVRAGVRVENKPQAQNSFVESFLDKVVLKTNQKDKDYEAIKYRTQPLDGNNRKRSQQGFDKTAGKRKVLTARERKNLKLFKLNKKDSYRYEDYLPLKSLWEDYAQDLLGNNSIREGKTAQITPKLLKADYHGCLLSVQRSKCPSYVGTSGIVLQESRNMFTLVTPDNKLKEIPKANTVFMFGVGELSFRLYGNQFRVRASDRVRRRFKLKSTVDL